MPLKRRPKISKLYELDISDGDIAELLDVDGEINAVNFLRTIPVDAVKSIDDLVDVYDRTAWGVFKNIFRYKKPTLPWAYIFLDREYAVAKVARETLINGSGIKFAHYSVLSHPRYPSETHSVGIIWIKDKASLAKIADTSVLWDECWRVLKTAHADKRYISILDPLPMPWTYRNENGEVFNVWHEMKAHAAGGRKSDEHH